MSRPIILVAGLFCIMFAFRLSVVVSQDDDPKDPEDTETSSEEAGEDGDEEKTAEETKEPGTTKPPPPPPPPIPEPCRNTTSKCDTDKDCCSNICYRKKTKCTCLDPEPNCKKPGEKCTDHNQCCSYWCGISTWQGSFCQESRYIQC